VFVSGVFSSSPFFSLCGKSALDPQKAEAARKQWPLEAVTVRLRHSKIHAEDCRDCETKIGMLDQIERSVELVGIFDETQRSKLLEIADKCPVHRTLTSEIVIRSR
jgi:uncharacterized OsmC-like protein